MLLFRLGSSLLCRSPISLGLSASACVLLGLSFSLGLRLSGRLRIRLGLVLRILHCVFFRGDSVRFLFLERQHARVFRGLRCPTRHGSNRSSALLPLQIVFRPRQHVFRFAQTVGGILGRPGGFGDGDRVASFQQIERRIRSGFGGGKLIGGNVDGVLPTFQHVELGVNGLFEAFGILANHIFDDHQVAGPRDREVRLRRYDQAECLQVGGDVKLLFPSLFGTTSPRLTERPSGVTAHST